MSDRSNKSEQAIVLLPGKLKLKRAEETRLMEHCIKRRTGVRTEMGWMSNTAVSGMGVTGGDTIWRGSSCTGWALIRQEASAMYENDMSFRAFPSNSRRYSKLFRYFNTTMNIPKRAIEVFKARACESLVNTDPFMGLMPKGDNDNPEAIKAAERVLHAKMEESDVRYQFREGIRQAAVSEAVMKITLVPNQKPAWLDQSAQIYLTPDGQPILDSTGNFVFCDEELDDDPDVIGVEALVRDPTVRFNGTQMKSEPQQMMRPGRTSLDLDIKPVGFENFFCSLLEPDIHKSDCIFHEFDESYDDLLRRTKGMRVTAAAKGWLETFKSATQSYPMSEGGLPHPNRGERDVDLYGPLRVHVCEMWVRFDVLDRGQADELCVIWAVSSGGTEMWPIYYDLMQNASPTGKRPFEVLRAIPVKDRWYGFGFYDLLSNDHDDIDEAVNRIRARSSSSGRLDWIQPDAWDNLDYGQIGELSTGKVYRLKSDKEGEGGKYMGTIELPPLDEKIWEYLKLRMQNAQLMSGTMTAGDAAQSDLPANKTATGQDMLANESELMSGDTMQELIRGIVATLKQALVAVFETPDDFSKQLLMEYCNELLGLNTSAMFLQWLSNHEPENFGKHLKLLLTKSRSQQQMQAASSANQIITGNMSWVQIVQQFPQWADKLKTFFEMMLNSLDIPNAADILKIPQEVLAQAMQQQQMTAQQPSQLPVKQMGQTSVPGQPPNIRSVPA